MAVAAAKIRSASSRLFVVADAIECRGKICAAKNLVENAANSRKQTANFSARRKCDRRHTLHRWSPIRELKSLVVSKIAAWQLNAIKMLENCGQKC